MSYDSPFAEKGPSPGDTSTHFENSKMKTDHVEPGATGGTFAGTGRNLSVATDNGRQYSTGGPRRMSEWDAMKIAKEGGVEIDEEIELLDQELAQNPIKHSIFSPVIDFKDPRHFTYGHHLIL